MSIIFHVDVNSAFLSWSALEELKKGEEVDLREVPSIVGGDQSTRHGVVLAKSLPARKYGIHTGEPVVNAFRKCPDLRTVAPDHETYRRYSRKLMSFLQEFISDLEPVSIDECYLDATEFSEGFETPVEAAAFLKDRVKETFGFTVNVGVSTNKLLAKMASDFEKPDKVHTLFPEEIQKKMWKLSVRELFMAGRASTEVLKKLEISTIGQLAQADPVLLESHLKSHGRRLWEFANGVDTSPLQTERQAAKGVGNSVTLPEDLKTQEELFPVLLSLSRKVGKRLSGAGQKALALSVEIKYYNFETSSHQKPLETATDDPMVLYKAATGLFLERWNGKPVRLLGVRSMKLVSGREPRQMSLFEREVWRSPQRERLEKDMKKLQKTYGEQVLAKGFRKTGKRGEEIYEERNR